MATLLPAMQGKFGSTDFWIVTMPAKELTERLTIPKEIDRLGKRCQLKNVINGRLTTTG